MELSKAMLDELTAGFKTPQELKSLYAQMLQHMVNRSLGNHPANFQTCVD